MNMWGGASHLTVGDFADQRGESSTWIGAIRSAYGNPIKVLETDRPVAELVKEAVADGLRSRGVAIDPSAEFQLTGIIKKLECIQVVRREAEVEIEIKVIDKSGRSRFAKAYKATNLEGSMVTFNAGFFGSVDDLRVVVEKTLGDVVDKALDDSALRAAPQP